MKTSDHMMTEAECKELINAECAIVERHYEKEIERLRAERDALVRAIDEHMVLSEIGVFNLGDDPKVALNKIAVYEQSVGAYFNTKQLDAARKGEA